MTTTITTFTADDALDALRKAIELRGSYRTNPGANRSCYYVEDDGTPACIVATAFHIAGLPLPTPGTDENEHGIKALIEEYRFYADTVRFTNGAVQVLAEAQVIADEGGTWGSALQYATDGVG